MINAQDIIRIAQQQQGALLYKDFFGLRPQGTKGYHFLFRVKRVLIDNGYVCHERSHGDRWMNCGYYGNHTHFHKPISEE